MSEYTKGKLATKTTLKWRCHTPRLFDEILLNPGTSTLKQPLIIFRAILVEVAQRAIELNDDELNLLMLRLTLYDCADPLCKNYNPDIIHKLEQSLHSSAKAKPEQKG
ncbi:hypothetical protein LCGC14_2913950 [marine sediment metagenome]|uniref:Uncharacterized protein n=1 Tax=marine sediment metagenome TaxID=412755 RepID=A0A0F8ZYI0_9ZZZZ